MLSPTWLGGSHVVNLRCRVHIGFRFQFEADSKYRALKQCSGFVSHKVFLKSFCESQFPHESVNLFFTLVIVKKKLMDLWGGWTFANDFKFILCEVQTP